MSFFNNCINFINFNGCFVRNVLVHGSSENSGKIIFCKIRAPMAMKKIREVWIAIYVNYCCLSKGADCLVVTSLKTSSSVDNL